MILKSLAELNCVFVQDTIYLRILPSKTIPVTIHFLHFQRSIFYTNLFQNLPRLYKIRTDY